MSEGAFRWVRSGPGAPLAGDSDALPVEGAPEPPPVRRCSLRPARPLPQVPAPVAVEKAQLPMLANLDADDQPGTQEQNPSVPVGAAFVSPRQGTTPLPFTEGLERPFAPEQPRFAEGPAQPPEAKVQSRCRYSSTLERRVEAPASPEEPDEPPDVGVLVKGEWTRENAEGVRYSREHRLSQLRHDELIRAVQFLDRVERDMRRQQVGEVTREMWERVRNHREQ